MDTTVLHDLKRIAELSRALTVALDKLFEDLSGIGGGVIVHMDDLVPDLTKGEEHADN